MLGSTQAHAVRMKEAVHKVHRPNAVPGSAAQSWALDSERFLHICFMRSRVLPATYYVVGRSHDGSQAGAKPAKRRLEKASGLIMRSDEVWVPRGHAFNPRGKKAFFLCNMPRRRSRLPLTCKLHCRPGMRRPQTALLLSPVKRATRHEIWRRPNRTWPPYRLFREYSSKWTQTPRSMCLAWLQPRGRGPWASEKWLRRSLYSIGCFPQNIVNH